VNQKMKTTLTTDPAVLRAIAIDDLWQHAATSMDALYELQCSAMWALLPIDTRRAICAARCHCEAITTGIDEA